MIEHDCRWRDTKTCGWNIYAYHSRLLDLLDSNNVRREHVMVFRELFDMCANWRVNKYISVCVIWSISDYYSGLNKLIVYFYSVKYKYISDVVTYIFGTCQSMLWRSLCSSPSKHMKVWCQMTNMWDFKGLVDLNFESALDYFIFT